MADTVTKGRILCVTSNFPRWEGDSTTPFVLNLAEDIQELGWEVDVLAPHAPGCERVETINGVHVERFQYLWPESMETVCYQGGALINLRKKPSNFIKLPALLTSEMIAVTRRLLSGKYDLLHSHWILPQGFVGSLASRIARLPHVITVHGGDIFGLRQNWVQPFKRSALRMADAVTVNSSVTENAVHGLVPDIEILNRIPMGVSIGNDAVDISRINDIRSRYRRNDGPLLLFVGRIVEEKGVGDLIQALALLAESMPDATLLLVGEGQDRTSMEKIANKIIDKDRIFFQGWVDPKDINYYYKAADIFIGPSRTSKDGWIEAQGLTFLEAMEAKIPVIATNSGGITDTVIDGVTGILINEKTPKDICSAVLHLVNNAAITKKIIDNGYKMVHEHYSRNISAMAFSSLFDDLIHPVRINQE